MLRVFLALLLISLGLAACGDEPTKDIAKNPEVQRGIEASNRGDYAEALDILMPLAEQGEARAMNVIGVMYRNGEGVVPSHELACDWYQKSAEAGDMRGQRNFGICFRHERGRELDLQVAEQWFLKSADQGYVKAMISLMNLYRELGNREAFIHWSTVAANNGSVAGKYILFLNNESDRAPPATPAQWGCFLFYVLPLDKSRTACDGN